MLLEILTSSKVNQTYMLPDFEQKEDAIPLFRRLAELSEKDARFVRCIDLDGTAIGFINDVEIKNDTIELGYVVHPDYHNRGFMTAALRLAIAELFRIGYREIICGAFEGNAASMRVMEKCGMIRVAHTDIIEYRGQSHRCIYYRTTK
jgi:RimJ/RimL family protein N-acetyltransferase